MEINMPTSSGEGGVGILDAAIDPKAVVGEAEAAAVEDEGDHSGIYVTKEQLSDKMLTLSLVPRTRWQTLLHLDIIKQRNKPEKAPTKPEKAPFFLGALPGIKDASNPNTLNNTLLNPSVSSSSFSALTQNTNTTDTAALAAERSRISRLAVAAQQNGSAITTESTTLLEESLATRLLRQCASSSPSNRDFTPFITHFKTLPPSSADLEIRSLISPYWDLLASSDGSEEGDEEDQHTTWEGFLDSDLEEVEEEEPFDELATFITALTARLKQNLDYELLNAWMSVLLRVHGESIVQVLSCLPRIDSDGGSGEGKEKGKSKKEKMKIKRAERLDRALREWKGEQERERERVLGLVGYCVGVVGFLKGGR